MNFILLSIAQTFILHTISSLSNTITTTQNIINFVMMHKNNDYHNFKLDLDKTDINNKLNIILSIIKSIIKKYYFNDIGNFDELINNKNTNENYHNEFEIINANKIENVHLSDPLKIIINSNLDTIKKIQLILYNIHVKILNHDKSYSKYIYKIKIKNEIDDFMLQNKIFEKKIKMLFKICKLYNIII